MDQEVEIRIQETRLVSATGVLRCIMRQSLHAVYANANRVVSIHGYNFLRLLSFRGKLFRECLSDTEIVTESIPHAIIQ